jgi:hypothetical protein
VFVLPTFELTNESFLMFSSQFKLFMEFQPKRTRPSAARKVESDSEDSGEGEAPPSFEIRSPIVYSTPITSGRSRYQERSPPKDEGASK